MFRAGASHSGMVLLFALLFLLLLSLVAGSAMQTSIQEFRMAGNDQLREVAFQKAQALISAIAENPDNFSLDGSVGRLICASADDAPQCDPDLTVVVAPQVTSVAVGQSLRYTVERQGPLLRDALPIRTLQRFSSSTVAYDAAVFEARVVVEGGSSRGGRSELVQGVAILVASSNQGRWN
jgi:hypothetical protein